MSMIKKPSNSDEFFEVLFRDGNDFVVVQKETEISHIEHVTTLYVYEQIGLKKPSHIYERTISAEGTEFYSFTPKGNHNV